jgi:hypothetical protein
MRIEEIQKISDLPLIHYEHRPNENQCIFGWIAGDFYFSIGGYYQITHINHPRYGYIYYLVIVGKPQDYATDLAQKISSQLSLSDTFEDISTKYVSRFILHPKRR